ncbi:MAG: PEP-CTERM sorting domain-containing protein [Colwellia sp.]|jgi:hypothetical protein|nr:PEP-CTERM sorting domain-containing protein [Colwellia sp.]
MTNLVKKLSFATLLAFGSVTSAQALVLDSFDYNVALTGSTANGTTSSSSLLSGVTNTIPAGDVLYTLSTTSTSVLGPNAGASSTTGVMYLFNNDGTSNLTLDYSDVGAAPLDITDLGASNTFYFDVEFIDLGFTFDFTVTDFVGAISTVSYDQLVAIPSAAPTERVYVSFSDFVGSADFANVATISAAITGSTAGADLTISEVGTTSIPEPTTIAIFGLALVGFAFSSKRKA